MTRFGLALVLVASISSACGGDDGSSGGTAEDSETTADDTTESTGGGANQGPYWPCSNPGDCFEFEENDTCLQTGDGTGAGFCTIGCSTADECSEHPGGTAVPDCITALTDPVCVLDCASGSCPTGMFCKQLVTGDGVKSLCFDSSQ